MQKALESNLKILNKGLSGYELSTALIRNGYKLDISRASLQVLIYLASCYNGKPVFPRLQTIAECTLLSIKGVQLALKELLQKNCILKSHKSKNNQCLYSFQTRVIELANIKEVSTTEHGNDYQSGLEVSTKPMYNKLNNTEVKEQQTDVKSKPSEKKKNVVVFSSKFPKKHKPITLDDVPHIIKGNKNIQKPCAYWASLSDEIKAEYRQKNAEVIAAAKKIEEKKQTENAEKERQKAEFEAIKQRKQLPLTEQYTRNAAIEIVKKIHKITTNSTLANSLIEAFCFTDDELTCYKSLDS